MLSLCLLLFSILLLTVAIAQWLADTSIARSLRYIYAVVISTVLISVLYDAILIAGLSRLTFITAALVLSGVPFIYMAGPSSSGVVIPPFTLRRRITLYPILALALICYVSHIFISYSSRWGRWDARAIWTLHALFLTDPQHWADQFSRAISWSHADYPLMLSSLIAMVWRAIGHTDALVPCVIAYLTCIAIPLMAAAAVRQKYGALAAILVMIVFACTRDYAGIAAYQGADTLLSLFILIPFILTRQAGRDDIKLLFLAGLFAGFAGWVKNEGIAFLIVFSLGLLWRCRQALRLFMPYAYGMLLPLSIILIFKICYAPANDIIHGQNHGTISRLLDISRYKLTAIAFIGNARASYPVLLGIVALILLREVRRLLDLQLFLLIVMIAVYYFTFIITPRDLAWHLETASLRLFIQLFPALAFVLVTILCSDDVEVKSITG